MRLGFVHVIEARPKDGDDRGMPARDWEDFLERHHRPHLLIVDLERPDDSTALVTSVRQLVRNLKSSADYAMYSEGEEIKVALESDQDALALRQLLAARIVEHGGEDWSTTSVCKVGSRLKTVRRRKARM